MIQLLNVVPEPLKGHEGLELSQIWQSDCTFEQGKNYLVAAPSGKGKSTFLHLIYGLRKDYEGDIFFQGNNIRKLEYDDWSELRQKIYSLVFQDLRLFLQLTGRENVLLNAGTNAEEVKAHLDTKANILGVGHLLDKKCQTLSYGQRQRVAILRAIFQPFDYLLLDEPFSHLDDENIKFASDLIKEACEKNDAGMILVSLGEDFHFAYDEELLL